MTAAHTFDRVKRGRRPDHARFGPAATAEQLDAATRAPYRGIPRVPAGTAVWDWRVCGCDYVTPLVDGLPVRQDDNPAYAWTEEPARTRQAAGILSVVVRDLVLLYELGYFHARDAFRAFPGFPDCTIWGAGGRLVRELKGMTTDTYGQQLATLTTMRLAGDDVGVWKPCCLLCGRVSAELTAAAGRTGPHPEDRYAQPGGRPAVSGAPLTPAPRQTVLQAPPGGPGPARRRRTAAVADRLAPRSPAGDRPPPVLPGVPVTGGDAGRAWGLLVPLTSRIDGNPAARQVLDGWIREQGFSLADVPYPIRLVVGEHTVRVQCRVGISRPGTPAERVWRACIPTRPFPFEELVDQLDIDVVDAPCADAAAALIGDATASADLPYETGATQ